MQEGICDVIFFEKMMMGLGVGRCTENNRNRIVVVSSALIIRVLGFWKNLGRLGSLAFVDYGNTIRFNLDKKKTHFEMGHKSPK